jgi:hypothetical protein
MGFCHDPRHLTATLVSPLMQNHHAYGSIDDLFENRVNSYVFLRNQNKIFYYSAKPLNASF